MEQAKDVIITYQTVYEMLRRELDREELQKLPNNFFLDVAMYIRDKEILAKEQSLGIINPHAKQLENVHRIIHQLVERRERKILHLGLDSVRSSRLITSDAMLPHEKQLFDNTITIINQFRVVAMNLVRQPIPLARLEKPNTIPPGFTIVKFLEQVPKLIGPELEEYGPFSQHEIATLPQPIVAVLLENNRAIVLGN